MNEMIEKLKKNLAKFGNLTEEEKKCLVTIGISNCEVLMDCGSWEEKRVTCFSDNVRYRIKESCQHQPKPEIERCEVFINKNCYGFDELVFLRRGMERGLEMALRLTDFIGYEYKSGTISMQPRLYANRADTATAPDYVLFKK